MNFIIYDLEATCWKGRPRTLVQETIEIGAVLINEYGEVLGTYNKFIKPVLNPLLSSFCRELTSISQEQVNRSNKFPEVIESFQDWADIHVEPYLLCSWGNFDRIMFERDCELHDIDSDWVEPHIDLKVQYKKNKRMHRQPALRRTLENEGIDFIGIQHRAISDAENTAKLFLKYLDEWSY